MSISNIAFYKYTHNYTYLTLSGSISFDGFQSNGNGGAINNKNVNITILGTSTFSDNLSTNYGGAIYTNNSDSDNVTISGANTFSNNKAKKLGGAIYSKGKITITADSGDIVFRGNTANSSPNAIYMSNSSNDKILSLAAVISKSVNVQNYSPTTTSISVNIPPRTPVNSV
jgi:predicted outer membrane repeat protein